MLWRLKNVVAGLAPKESAFDLDRLQILKSPKSQTLGL